MNIDYDRRGTCTECGATVIIYARDLHTNWHLQLVTILSGLRDRLSS